MFIILQINSHQKIKKRVSQMILFTIASKMKYLGVNLTEVQV